MDTWRNHDSQNTKQKRCESHVQTQILHALTLHSRWKRDCFAIDNAYEITATTRWTRIPAPPCVSPQLDRVGRLLCTTAHSPRLHSAGSALVYCTLVGLQTDPCWRNLVSLLAYLLASLRGRVRKEANRWGSGGALYAYGKKMCKYLWHLVHLLTVCCG